MRFIIDAIVFNFVFSSEMFRFLLVVLGLFTELIFRDVLYVACLDQEACSARDQECNAEEKDSKYPQLVRLDGVKVGHVQDIKLKEGEIHQLITKSLRPLLFEIPDFLSTEECEHIIKLAGKEGLFESATMPDPEGDSVTAEEKNENCQHLFSNDKNSDDKISALELAIFIKEAFNISVNEADVDVMLQKINFDKDSDGLISRTECTEGDHLAFSDHLRYLEDRTPQQRTRLSQQAWLKVTGSTDPVLRDIQERVLLLTKLPRIFIERSEELQVVKYGVQGHYHAHYDSTDDWDGPVGQCCGGDKGNCSLCRFMTVLYYLNDVPRGGETAFPVADEEDFNRTDYQQKDRSNLSYHCHDANVVVRPKKGTAIMWYNHVISNVTGLLGAQDARSLHGGCDVLEGTKWIANNWINAPFEWTDDKHWFY